MITKLADDSVKESSMLREAPDTPNRSEKVDNTAAVETQFINKVCM